MKGRITVVFFKTAYDTLGGGSQMLLRLLDGLDKSEFEPILLTQKRDAVARKAEEFGISVHIVPYRGALDTYDGGLLEGSMLKKSAAVLRILQFNVEARPILEQADIVWIDEIRSYTTLLPYILIRKPTTIWNIGLLQVSDGIVAVLHELALRTTDYVFIESYTQAQTNFTSRQFSKYSTKFKVFHKGIDTERFSPSSRNEGDVIKIGTAALIHPRKNIDVLIDAFAKIDKENIELHIAGEPAREGNEKYLEELQEKVSEYGLESSVKFHGWVDEIESFYDSLDIFVLASENEGIPGAVREALAMEVPVVATDVGGTSEVVIPDKTGYLVEPKNSTQLAEKVSHLLSNPAKRREFGIQGRSYVMDHFSINSYITDYENFLQSIALKRISSSTCNL